MLRRRRWPGQRAGTGRCPCGRCGLSGAAAPSPPAGRTPVAAAAGRAAAAGDVLPPPVVLPPVLVPPPPVVVPPAVAAARCRTAVEVLLADCRLVRGAAVVVASLLEPLVVDCWSVAARRGASIATLQRPACRRPP